MPQICQALLTRQPGCRQGWVTLSLSLVVFWENGISCHVILLMYALLPKDNSFSFKSRLPKEKLPENLFPLYLIDPNDCFQLALIKNDQMEYFHCPRQSIDI